jgi:hypothetical protein
MCFMKVVYLSLEVMPLLSIIHPEATLIHVVAHISAVLGA